MSTYALKRTLLVRAGLVCLIGAFPLTNTSSAQSASQKGDKDVRVVNSPGDPVPTIAQGTTAITNVDEPARHAFQTTVQITIPDTDGAAMNFVVVPRGKRLVVEFVSVHGNVVHGRGLLVQMSTFGAVGEVFHEIALNDPRPLGNDIYTASQLVRVYAEEQLTLRAVHSGGSWGLASNVSVGISGYLVDVL